MKKNIFRIFLLLTLICLVFSFASCDKLPFDIPGFSSGDEDGDKDNDTNGDGSNTDSGNNNNQNQTVVDESKLVLIENGKANFQVVYTMASASTGKAIADNFVKQLKELGVDIADAVSDRNAEDVKECELIIGSDVRNRGDECCITSKYLGEHGQAVKIVGKKIIIATGSPSTLSTRFNTFSRNQLGISNKTTSIGDLISVEKSYNYEKLTEYLITSITVDGVDLKNFTFVTDLTGYEGYSTTNISAFRDRLYNVSGYWLEVGDVSKLDTYENYFLIRRSEDAGESGFRAYVTEDGNFIVECAYNNAFDTAFSEFTSSVFTNKQGAIKFAYDYTVDAETEVKVPKNVYTKTVSVAYYEDFGAKGDGKSCDFDAIYNTHIYANVGGQTVMSRGGENAKYYISPDNFTKSIPVKTNVDLNGATFLVNDYGESAYKYRTLHLFLFARENAAVVFNDAIKDVEVLDNDGNPVLNDDGTTKMTTNGVIDDERFQNIKIPYGTTKFEWLVGILEAKSLVRITNSKHRDFIRHGSNQNSGNNRIDIFVVDVDGTVAEDTPVAYDFDNISKIEIFRTDDKPITFKNGNFVNTCCRTVASTQYTTPAGKLTKYANKYHAYSRGLQINRTNVTIENVTHKMDAEPNVGWYPAGCGYVTDIKHTNYGSRHESYPYYGFFYIYDTYNFYAYDCELTGHTTYYEDKPATASTGGQIPEPVAMGTYDLIVEYSSNVKLEKVVQPCATGLGDTRYWGIMSSNGSKNMIFQECEINRFDAHRGFWNAELYDTVIGHSFQVVGGGYLIADGVTKLTKDNFIMFRGDYGATFRGDITIKDCIYPGYTSYNTARGGKQNTTPYENGVIFSCGSWANNGGWTETDHSGAFWLWNFGYDCYMPINVTIDNFQTEVVNMSVFNDLPDNIFESSYVDEESVNDQTVKNPYRITQSITFKNMTAIYPNAKSDTCTKLRGIKTIWEK